MSDAKVKGIVHVIEDTKTFGQRGFRKRLVVLEQDNGRFQNFIPVEFIQDACDQVDGLNVGDEIEVTYRLNGRKWQRELDYRLIKEIWAFRENRIAVRFVYEWHDDSGNWFRSYGNENWEFDEQGLMGLRIASINDAPITESDRRYRWPLGRRPDDHPSLSDLGL